MKGKTTTAVTIISNTQTQK